MTQLYGHSGRGLEIKKGMIQDATFIVAEPGHVNQDILRGDEAKTRRSRMGIGQNKVANHIFDTNCIRLLIKKMS
jgi:IS5 family transposase